MRLKILLIGKTLALMIGFSFASYGIAVENQYEAFEKKASEKHKLVTANTRSIQTAIEELSGSFSSIISDGQNAKEGGIVETIGKRVQAFLEFGRELEIRVIRISPYDENLREAHLMKVRDLIRRMSQVSSAMESVTADASGEFAKRNGVSIEYRTINSRGLLEFTGVCSNGEVFAGHQDNVYPTMPFGACGPSGCESGATPEEASQKSCGE